MVKYKFSQDGSTVELEAAYTYMDALCGGLGDQKDAIWEVLIEIGLCASAQTGTVTPRTLDPVLSRLTDSGAINEGMGRLCRKVFDTYKFESWC